MNRIVGTIFELLQYFSLFLGIFIAYFTIKRATMNHQWFFDIPLLLWLIHGFVYYMTLILVIHVFGGYDTIFFTSWSSALRFHGYVTLLIIAVTNYIRERQKWIRH